MRLVLEMPLLCDLKFTVPDTVKEKQGRAELTP